MAIGIVLARPDKKSVQPSTFRFSRLNFQASNKPAPNPIAPRVAAINAISGTVTLLGFEIFMAVFLTPPESIGEINAPLPKPMKSVPILLARHVQPHSCRYEGPRRRPLPYRCTRLD